jgi:hypothetical protein
VLLLLRSCRVFFSFFSFFLWGGGIFGFLLHLVGWLGWYNTVFCSLAFVGEELSFSQVVVVVVVVAEEVVLQVSGWWVLLFLVDFH